MEQVILIAFYLVTLIYSIIFHEVSHGVAALWLGDKTAKYAGRLSLEPIRHIDLMGSIVLPIIMILMTGFAFGWAKPVPYNPHNLRWHKWGSVMVAFAGPITNFILALLAAIGASMINIPIVQKNTIVNHLMGANWDSLVPVVVGSPLAIMYTIFAMIIFWNVLLGAFNLMPIPPLDGSKLIFTVFRVKPQIQMFLERWGFFLILALLMIPIFATPFRILLTNLWSFFFYISF